MKDKIVWYNNNNVRIEVPLASIGMRILAFIVDTIFKGLFVGFIFYLFFEVFTVQPGMAFILILASPYLFYSFLFEAFNDGQTPGKRVCNIKVTSMNGRPAGTQAFFLRWIFRLIDFSLMSSLVALLVAAMTEKRQRVGDLVANTVVVDTKVTQRAIYQAYTPIPDSYEPIYSEAKKLTRDDVVLIKEILEKEMGIERDALVVKMHNKVIDEYNIRSNEPPRRMLFTLVKDYNYFKQKET